MAKKRRFLLLDGYNIIFSWNELKEMANESLEIARDRLLDIMSNYAGTSNEEIIVVFDAHKVKGNIGTIIEHNNIKVVYTKEAEIADSYIEKAVTALSKNYNVRVASSDALEQIIILGKGAIRVSARELEEEVRHTEKEIRKTVRQMKPVKNNDLMSNVDKETAEWLERLRMED